MAMRYDRSVEDLGNIVALEHVNVRVPDQRPATLFYMAGLGLTRDPYLMASVTNMWANAGRSQFHLPTGGPEVLRGRIGLVTPDREALLARLEKVREPLKGTKFAFEAHNDHVDATCPWGNRIRVHEPDRARFGPIQLGMPYVEFPVPEGSARAIARFYREIMAAPAEVREEDGAPAAHAAVGHRQELIYRETREPLAPYDGHHLAIYLADFSGPHKRLAERGLVSEESDQHQYRFKDIVDLDSGKVLFTIEHEVRSMTHPLAFRPLVNRNPAQSNLAFAAGHESVSWSLPYEG
jgi:catechol 2,3-dioxygenase-like lactoylglutathione lyase family enzyme